MDTQPIDHNFHSADMHDLHKDLHTPQDLQTHQDLLSDPTIGVNHDPFAPSSIGVYEPNHVHAGFDGHNFADYQPHHANSLLDDQYSQVGHTAHLEHSFQNQHLADYQSNHANSLLDHHHFADSHHSQSLVDAHFDHLSQRSGSTNFTPSSSNDISENKEVIFKDADRNEQSGTVTQVNSNNTYTVQTSHGTYENVAYHDIQKYGSK
jgi:hypothetical protein